MPLPPDNGMSNPPGSQAASAAVSTNLFFSPSTNLLDWYSFDSAGGEHEMQLQFRQPLLGVPEPQGSNFQPMSMDVLNGKILYVGGYDRVSFEGVIMRVDFTWGESPSQPGSIIDVTEVYRGVEFFVPNKIAIYRPTLELVVLDRYLDSVKICNLRDLQFTEVTKSTTHPVIDDCAYLRVTQQRSSNTGVGGIRIVVSSHKSAGGLFADPDHKGAIFFDEDGDGDLDRHILQQ